VRGPSLIKVLNGSIEIFGCKLFPDEDVTVISGRQVPLLVSKYSSIEFKLGSNADYEVISENPIPKDWMKLYEVLSRSRVFKAIILGDIDVGKSSLILYLANMLIRDGYRIGVIDADIGQSDIGPPGTIGLSIIDECIPSFDKAELYDAYFIGDKTPTGHLLPVVIGTLKMVEKALSHKVDGILINTTGYIHGGVARALKKYKIEAVNPSHIIGLSLGRELIPLINYLGIREKMILLEAPKYIARKEHKDRRVFRHLKMGAYFYNCKEHILDLREIRLENTVIGSGVKSDQFIGFFNDVIGIKPEAIYTDKNDIYLIFKRRIDKSTYMKLFNKLRRDFNNVKIVSIESIKGLYLGLYKEREFKGVGRLEDIDFKENKIIFTASRDIENIDRIVFGYLLLDEKFNEKGSIKPGFLG